MGVVRGFWVVGTREMGQGKWGRDNEKRRRARGVGLEE